jgi:AcrR family transcriptional regulator
MAGQHARKRYHHGDLRSALIQAGTQLLKKQGVVGLSLRAAAKRSGVSHTAPYRHFHNKEALLAAIAAVGFDELTAAMQEVTTKHPRDPSKQLIEAGVAYVLLAVRNPERAQLMFGGSIDFEAADEALRQSSRRAFDGLVQIVEHGLQAGIYREGDVRKLALSAWAIVHGLATLIIADRLKEAASSEEQVVQLTRYICQIHQSGLLRHKK